MLAADVEEDIDCVACRKGFAPATWKSENVLIAGSTELQRKVYIEVSNMHNSILLSVSTNSMDDSNAMTLTSQQINIPLRLALSRCPLSGNPGCRLTRQ